MAPSLAVWPAASAAMFSPSTGLQERIPGASQAASAAASPPATEQQERPLSKPPMGEPAECTEETDPAPTAGSDGNNPKQDAVQGSTMHRVRSLKEAEGKVVKAQLNLKIDDFIKNSLPPSIDAPDQ